jgi:hypothetical protein
MILPSKSIEQENIILSLKKNDNVLVDAVAGSGKTTSILHIALEFMEYKILVITYNSKLRLETREKIAQLEIPNIEIHTYHSFCVNYYSNICFEDNGLHKIIDNETITSTAQTYYNIIIIDEVQDMSLLYYNVIKKIYAHNTTINVEDITRQNAQLCILGDVNQSIYQFNGADDRFIRYADTMFNFNSFEWSKCNLSTSYRITNKMCDFINISLFNNNRIKSIKNSDYKPNYIICNCFERSKASIVYEEVIRYLNMGYKADDIIILAPSIKNSNSPVSILENRLKLERNIPIFIPSCDEDNVDDVDIMKNKLLFLSFHQSKGLERKVAIIFSFDKSYFNYYCRDEINTFYCPNTIYVAITRAKEQLTVIHHTGNEYFDFINTNSLLDTCNFIDHTVKNKKRETPAEMQRKLKAFEDKPRIFSVTELISFLTYDVIESCMCNIIKTEIQAKSQKIDINNKIQTTINSQVLYENVSDITGTSMTILFDSIHDKYSSIMLELCKKNFEESVFNKQQRNQKYYISNFISQDILTIDEILYVANCWNSYKNKYFFKLLQINDYNWITEEILENLVYRFKKLGISSNFKSEVFASKLFKNKITINGYADCIDYDNKNFYEFKCVKELKNEHFIQVIIYMYLFETNASNETNETSETSETNELEYNYYIFNILTDELIQIICSYENICKIIEILINNKSKTYVKECDEVFYRKIYK